MAYVPHKRDKMKISRRTVVKGLTTLGTTALATKLTPAIASTRGASEHAESDDTLRVQIAHRWGDESIAAVIKNTSNHGTTITDINSVTADYGRFNFAELTKKGSLTLAAGEEVHVPFTVMGTAAKPYGHFDNRLQKHLQKSLRISTSQPFARVTTSLSPKIV